MLVVEPQFPAINQPWIDTYLEQLLRHGHELHICSSRRELGPYSPKVDALNLLDRTAIREFEQQDYSAAIKRLLKRPISLLAALPVALRAARLLSAQGLSLPRALFKALAFAENEQALPEVELIHSHGEFEAFEVMHFAAAKGIPLITTFHGLQPPGVPQLADDKRRALYGYCSAVLLNTEFAKAQAIGLGCPAEKIRVIPQGLPLPDFPFHTRSGELAEPHLLAVGRLQRDKGHAYTLGAIRRLRAAGCNATLTIVGVGSDRPRLEKLRSAYGLDDCVAIKEGLPSDALLQLFQSADIFVLASIDNSRGYHVETQGVVLQEAQASGLAVVATHVGGIPECIDHGENAELVRHRSSREIVTAVQRLLAMDTAAFQARLSAGRKNVETRFSADVVGEKISSLISEIVAK